nr:hypothetical protein JVH1_4280 [Rhodococcus sp. JVH1]
MRSQIRLGCSIPRLYECFAVWTGYASPCFESVLVATRVPF